jgi:hypothetical protein
MPLVRERHRLAPRAVGTPIISRMAKSPGLAASPRAVGNEVHILDAGFSKNYPFSTPRLRWATYPGCFSCSMLLCELL